MRSRGYLRTDALVTANQTVDEPACGGAVAERKGKVPGKTDTVAAQDIALNVCKIEIGGSRFPHGGWQCSARPLNIDHGFFRIGGPGLDLRQIVAGYKVAEVAGVLLHRQPWSILNEFEDGVELVAQHGHEVHQVSIQIAVILGNDQQGRTIPGWQKTREVNIVQPAQSGLHLGFDLIENGQQCRHLCRVLERQEQVESALYLLLKRLLAAIIRRVHSFAIGRRSRGTASYFMHGLFPGLLGSNECCWMGSGVAGLGQNGLVASAIFG